MGVMRRRRVQEKGFTFVELVIVILLIGLTVAVASVVLFGGARRTGVRAAVDEFASTHSLARAAAVRHGGTAELHISAPTGRFWVEVDTSRAGGRKDTVGVVKSVEPMGVTLSSDRSVLCFDARGLPTTRGSCEAPDATVTFTWGSRTDTVTITALGRLLR